MIEFLNKMTKMWNKLKKMSYNQVLLLLLGILVFVMIMHVYIAGCGTYEAYNNRKANKAAKKAEEAAKKAEKKAEEEAKKAEKTVQGQIDKLKKRVKNIEDIVDIENDVEAQ